jgi:hypothetical protein
MRLKNNICRVLYYLKQIYFLRLVPERIGDVYSCDHYGILRTWLGTYLKNHFLK